MIRRIARRIRSAAAAPLVPLRQLAGQARALGPTASVLPATLAGAARQLRKPPAILRVGGARPVLLQTSVGSNFRGGIQMTNPSADTVTVKSAYSDHGSPGPNRGESCRRVRQSSIESLAPVSAPHRPAKTSSRQSPPALDHNPGLWPKTLLSAESSNSPTAGKRLKGGGLADHWLPGQSLAG